MAHTPQPNRPPLTEAQARARGQAMRQDVEALIRRVGLHGLGTTIVLLVAVLAVLAVLAAPGAALAQPSTRTPAPVVDCSLLTAQQAQGLPCAAPVPVPPTAPVPPPTPAADDPQTLADCYGVNPYADPERAAACARIRPVVPDAVPAFLVGHVYAYGYDDVRAVVLGVTQDLDGVQLVTVRWLEPGTGAAGAVTAVRTPPTPGGATAWQLVGRYSTAGGAR